MIIYRIFGIVPHLIYLPDCHADSTVHCGCTAALLPGTVTNHNYIYNYINIYLFKLQPNNERASRRIAGLAPHVLVHYCAVPVR